MAKYNDTSPEGRSIRTLRVGEQVRHILSELLQRGDVHDPRLDGLTISITEVRMSPDLRHATVFFKPLLGQHEEDVGKALKEHAGYLKGEVAKRVRMKYAAGKPTTQNPTPTPRRTSRQPQVSMARTRTGTRNPPTPVHAIRIASAFDRFLTNQLPTVETSTINVPNDIPRVSSAIVA